MQKKLLILGNKYLYAPKRFVEEAELMGVSTTVIDYRDITFKIENNQLQVIEISTGNVIEGYTHMIMRNLRALIHIRDAMTNIFMDKLRLMNAEHYKTTVGKLDKLNQYAVFAENNIDIPDTFLTTSPIAYMDYLNKVLENDKKLVKPVDGTKGDDISIVTKNESLLHRPCNYGAENILVQQILDSNSDMRVFVLGGKVVAAMKRSKGQDMVISNFSKGGAVENQSLDKELEELALKAASVFNLEMAGVDLMYDAKTNKYYVLEVNIAPGFEGLEKATELNVAKEILEYLLK